MATPKRQTKKNEKIEKKKTAPAYFLSLTVENVRCFSTPQTLDLSDGNGRPARWTIILGDNGVGKTTLLQCLAALTPNNRRDNSLKYLGDDKLSHEWEPMRYRNDSFLLLSDLSIGAKLTEQRPGKVADIGISYNSRLQIGYSPPKHIDFFCFGYGASRRMGETLLSDDLSQDSTASLFYDDAALLNAEEWLLQADYAARIDSPVQRYAIKRRDQIIKVLIELLPQVTDIRIAGLRQKQAKPHVEIETPDGWIPIRGLSLGYKTLIAWMVDFASRMFDIYSDSSDPLAEPAVVLIDEIDLHLHPQWQRDLMNYLSKRFPNTQFIATAHSPLVVQAATDANIVLLRRKNFSVEIDNNPQTIKGWRVDQILTSELFGLESARPPEYDEVLAERRKILAKARLTKKDKERLQVLQAKVEALPAMETLQDIEAMDIIRRAADILNRETAKSNNDSHK